MATFFDMRQSNPTGFNAKKAAGTLTNTHFNLSTQQLAGLTTKAPDIFMADLFVRSTKLVGNIWCVTCGPLSLLTPAGRDWQIHCQFDNANDLAYLKNGPSVKWLDVITLINWLNVNVENQYFDVDLQAIASGTSCKDQENQSILA